MALLSTGVWANSAMARVPAPYEFTLDSAASRLTGNALAGVSTTGTLIGNYNADTNPTGTRTKPGLFGSFGSTENVEVPVSLGLGIDENLSERAAGGFQATVDRAGGAISVAGLDIDYLSGGTLSLPASLALEYDSFRTRNPSATYPGGIPLEIPIGDVTISTLRVQQVGAGSLPGTITQVADNEYTFSVVPLVQLFAAVDFLGNIIEIPGVPTPLPLEGTIVFAGEQARLTSVRAVEFGNTVNPDLAIPEFAFGLPTLLPPGETANVLMNLSLSEIAFGLNGSQTITANGVLVPAPGTALLMAAGAWLAGGLGTGPGGGPGFGRRRRRSI
ncbi:MAG: hypothetical protein SFZ23_12085 [Planctomycetota bacterium]|nr:hypothetical protein [Planctomycetota bacterium]